MRKRVVGNVVFSLGPHFKFLYSSKADWHHVTIWRLNINVWRHPHHPGKLVHWYWGKS